MWHHEFNNNEMDCYILLRKIRILSGLSWEVRSESSPKQDWIRITALITHIFYFF